MSSARIVLVTCFSLLILGHSSVWAQAGRPTNAYHSYSRRVLQYADSVVYLARLQTRIVLKAMEKALEAAENGGGGEDGYYDQGGALSAPVAGAMRRRAGDFDAVTPPSRDFERLHQQIVDALKTAAEQADSVSQRLASLSCTSARRSGEGCYGPRMRQYRLPIFIRSLGAFKQAVTDYAEARERLTQMLAERSVRLAALNPDSNSAGTGPATVPQQ